MTDATQLKLDQEAVLRTAPMGVPGEGSRRRVLARPSGTPPPIRRAGRCQATNRH